jgi:NAD(P)H dehydrogenase (quinone)
MLIITGGNGHLGRATIGYLLQKGVDRRALRVSVREVAKATDLQKEGISIVEADYQDAEAMLEAFRGGDTLLLISGDAPVETRIAQHRRAVEAAKQAGVQHIIYTSVADAEASSPFTFSAIHADTENYIRQSGLSYTFFRNALYMDVLPMMLAPALQSGQLAMPTGEGRVSFALRDDIAEALANVLLQGSQAPVNQSYLISGQSAYTMQQVAQIASAITRQQIAHIPIPREAYHRGLLEAGLPPFMADAFSGMTRAIEEGRFEQTSNQLEYLLKRKPVDVKEYLEKALTQQVH